MKHNEIKVASHLSKNYKPISTSLVIENFAKRGWEVSKTIGNINGLKKHSVTLTHSEYYYANGDKLNIVINNSCDGSTRFSVYGGYFRLVCANGLVIGDFSGIRVKHIGEIYEQLDNAYDKIIAHLKNVKKDIQKLESYKPSSQELVNITENIARKLFNKENDNQKTEVIGISNNVLQKLFRVRRTQDLGDTSFLRLNVMQENIIRRGLLKAQVKITDKKTGKETFKTIGKRACENNYNNVSLNLLLTQEFLKVG